MIKPFSIVQIFAITIICMAFHAKAAQQINIESAGQICYQTDTFPAPENVADLLFYIQRSSDANTVCYTLNKKTRDQLNNEKPVNVFWIKYGDDGPKREELNYIQQTFAYGINLVSRTDEQHELRSVAHKGLPLILKKDKTGTYQMYATISNKECILNRIFIRIDGGPIWSPNVVYIELNGTAMDTGEAIVERIYPD